ncbi:unnamed protein product [Pylaiella littoralis]
MDPDGVLSLARRLRKCKSTSELSFTAVSLLSKTLTARATRLESTASRARLANEKEAYHTMTVAKRRRAQGPKNVSDFMRQTIRDREKSREKNRVRAERRAAKIPLKVESGVICRSGTLDQPLLQGASSGTRPSSPFRKNTSSSHSNRSAPMSSMDSSRASRARSPASDGRDRPLTSICETQKRNSASNRSFTPRVDHLDLEDDDDIRVLLDRVRAASLPRPATSSGKPSQKTRPVSGNPYGRSQAKVNPPPTKGGSPAERCEGFMRRPKSAGMHGWVRSLDGRKTDPSGVVQLRRELLIRSHGEGRNLRLFPTEPFETTAMGRKACCMDPGRGTELTPWMPAKTVSGLDKLERSRMLMNQRPVVPKLR